MASSTPQQLGNDHVRAMWACAETCLSQHPPNVTQAIRCLMGAANFVSGAVDVTVRIQTRLRLAQLLLHYTTEIEMVRDNIQKVFQMSDDSLSPVDPLYLFQATNLLLEVSNPSVALMLCNSMIQTARSKSHDAWLWHFHLRRVNFYFLEGNLSGCLTQLTEGIEDCKSRNDAIMQLVFLNEQLKYHALRHDIAAFDALAETLAPAYKDLNLQQHPSFSKVHFQFLNYVVIQYSVLGRKFPSKSESPLGDVVNLLKNTLRAATAASSTPIGETHWLGGEYSPLLGSLTLGLKADAAFLDVPKKCDLNNPFLKRMRFITLGNLVLVHLRRGEYDKATELFTELSGFVAEHERDLGNTADMLRLEALLAQCSSNPSASIGLWTQYSAKVAGNDSPRQLLADLHLFQQMLQDKTNSASEGYFALRSKIDTASGTNPECKAIRVAFLILMATDFVQRNQGSTLIAEKLMAGLAELRQVDDNHLGTLLHLAIANHFRISDQTKEENAALSAYKNAQSTKNEALVLMVAKVYQGVLLRTGQFAKASPLHSVIAKGLMKGDSKTPQQL